MGTRVNKKWVLSLWVFVAIPLYFGMFKPKILFLNWIWTELYSKVENESRKSLDLTEQEIFKINESTIFCKNLKQSNISKTKRSR